MSDATLPGVRAALVDPGGTTSRPFYTFFQSQATNLSALSERVSAIEAAPSGASNLSPNANVVGSYSISVQGTLRTGIVRVLLEGDVEFAGATNYYGSDSTGAKGWYAVSDALADSTNIVKSVDAGGVTSFDLTDVTVGSSGTLQKYGFDAKGRLNNQSSATTSDLSEGSNLYFTDERAQDAIGAALDGTGNVPLTYDDAGNKISAALSSGVLASLTLADSAVQSVVAGTGVSVDNTDPHNPVISTTGSGSGDVVGPASATNSAVALFDGTTGKLLKDGGALGTAAFANTGNNAAGVVPLLDSPATGQTSLTITGVSARANIYLQSGNADAPSTGEGTVSFAGTGSVSSSTEKRLGIFAMNTDGSTAGNRGGKFVINLKQNGNTSLITRFSVNYLGHTEPGADNAQTMGSSSLRWSVVYAGTGSINTSDARDKTDVVPLTAEELAAAADMSRSVGTYQWLESVQLKGSDARHHAGLTVQQAIAIMQAHGLNPFAYGFICYDQWPETPEVVETWPSQDAVLDDAGNVIAPAIEAGSEITQAYRAAGDRYSFRHDELLLFLARGFAARLDALEATLPA